MKMGLLVGLFVVAMLVLFPMSVAYTQSYDDISPQQEGWWSSFSGSVSKAVSKVVSTVRSVVRSVVSAVRSAFSGSSSPSSSSGNSGGGSSPGGGSSGGTTYSGGSGGSSSSGSGGSSSGSSSGGPSSSSGGSSGGGTTYNGGGGSGGGSGPNPVSSVIKYFAKIFNPPKQTLSVLRPELSAISTFQPSESSPFVSKKGETDPSSPSASQMAVAGFLGLTVLGTGAYLYRSNKANPFWSNSGANSRPLVAKAFTGAPAQVPFPESAKKNDFLGGLWDGAAKAVSGLGKTIAITVDRDVKDYSAMGGALAEGDLGKFGELYVDKVQRNIDFVVDTVKNHWKEIVVGVVVGAVLVATAPVWIPAAAVALGVSAATVATGAAITGVVAAAGYAAVTYGPMLARVDDECEWDGSGKQCDESIGEVKQQALSDGIIIGGSLGGGKLLSGPVAGAYVRSIPVEGLTDAEAVETYKIAVNSLEKAGGYARFKRIVVVDSNMLGASRAGTAGDVLFINKDTLPLWKAFPGTAGLHEIGHNTVTSGLSRTTPETVIRTFAGTKKGGMSIEVAAEKNAYTLGGDAYANEWQALRADYARSLIENPVLMDPSVNPDPMQRASYIYTVYKNMGATGTSNAIFESVHANNNPATVNIFQEMTKSYQAVWDATGVRGPSSVPGVAGGVASGSVAQGNSTSGA